MMRSNSLSVVSLKMAFVGASLSLLALSGCIKPQSHAANQDNATFYLDHVDGSSKAEAMVDGFSIPKSKLFTFKTCARERRTNDSIKGHKFAITGGENEVDVRTDDDGCLTWTETIAFNFLAPQYYLPITRTVTAIGSQSGSRTLSLAINPWGMADSSPDVVDLTHGDQVPENETAKPEQVASLLKGLDAKGAVVERPLYLKDTAVSSYPSGSSRVLKVDIAPQVLLVDLAGKPRAFDLTQARMQVDAAIIESITVAGRESTRVVWRSSQSSPATLEGSKYRAQFNAAFGAMEPTAKIELALRVTPQDGPAGLTAFDGVFELGSFTSFVSNGTIGGTLKHSNSDGSFSYSSTIESQKSDGQTTRLNQLGVLDQGTGIFRVGRIQTSFQTVSSDTGTKRRVSFEVRVCFHDETNGDQPVAHREPFVVTHFNDPNTPNDPHHRETVYVDDNTEDPGCVMWLEAVDHDYYDSEHFYNIPVDIVHYPDAKNPNGKPDFHLHRTIPVAPWERWNFTRDVDSPAQVQLVAQVNARQAVPNQLVPSGISFAQFNNTSYRVDPFLNPTIVKEGQLSLPISIWRPSNMLSGATNSGEPLRAGLYLLKAALYLPTSDPTCDYMKFAPCKVLDLISPLTGTKVRRHSQIVQVLQTPGTLNATVDLIIPDVRFLAGRTLFVFQVEPMDEARMSAAQIQNLDVYPEDPEQYIDHDAKILPQTFISLFDPYSTSGYLPFPSENVGKGLATPDGLRPYTKEQIAESMPLANLTIDELFRRYDDQQKQTQAILSDSNTLKSLAGYNYEFISLYNEKAVYQAVPELRQNNLMYKSDFPSLELLRDLRIDVTPYANLWSKSSALMTKHAPGAALVLPQDPKSITQQTLLDFVEGRSPINLNLGARLCVLLIDKLPRAMLSSGDFDDSKAKSWINKCMGAMFKDAQSGADKVFLIERKLRVLDVDHDRDLKPIAPGMTMNFSMGASLGFGRSSSHGHNVGLSASSILSHVTEAMYLFSDWLPTGAMIGAIGVTASIPGLMGMGWTLMSRDAGSSLSEGSSFSASTSLFSERYQLGIPVTKSESCISIRLNPHFMAEKDKGAFGGKKQRVQDSDGLRDKGSIYGVDLASSDPAQQFKAAARLSRGLLICSGIQNTTPRIVPETYYTVGNDNVRGVSTDKSDLINYPWLMQFRGLSDYARFIKFAKGQYTAESAENAPIYIERNGFDRLNKAHLDYIHDYIDGRMPAVPGVIDTELLDGLQGDDKGKAIDFDRHIPE